MSLDETISQVTRGGSLADQAYRALRESIATGRLAPGTRITERQLAAALDVSPTPVREAISKLELEGLVERVGVRRLQVTDHPDETLRELMQVEVTLRALEARFAARKISPDAIARMHGYIDEFVSARDTLTPTDQLALARRFDDEVAAAAANPALRSLIESFAIYGPDYRLQTIDREAGDRERVDRRLREHREILDALEAGDEDAAERLMRAHARSATELS